MLKINILTLGFKSPNASAFLFPLLVHKSALRDAGYQISLHTEVNARLCECDIIIVDSKFYSSKWLHHTDQVLSV